MKKRFVIIIEVSTKEQNDAFLAWIKAEKLGWWHWFQNTWLLSNPAGSLRASGIRDKLRECFGTANTLVLELKNGEDTWAGFGPKTDDKDMFKWLRKNWSKD